MNDAELGGVVRGLRHRRGWRQADLAKKAGVSAALIGLLERGHAESLSVRCVRGISTALDLRLGWDAGYRGAELGRLRDADHARLAEWLTRRMEAHGWTVSAEVSFNHYGDRGRIDLLAYHAMTGTLLVVEIKTVIADVQDLLGGLHVKQRVALGVARSLGWRPARAIPLLVVAESTTNRRRIAAHERLFGRLALRGKAAYSWLRRPTEAPDGLLILAKLPDRNGVDARRAGRLRMRLRRSDSSVSPASGGAPGPTETA